MNPTAQLRTMPSARRDVEASAPITSGTTNRAGRFPLSCPSQLPLAELVRTASRDDLPSPARHAAFGEMVRRFQDFAFGLALGTLGDRALAEDAAQESFVVAWQNLGSLREPEAFPGWFGQIVRSRCHRATRRRRATVSFDALGDGSSEPSLRETLTAPERLAEQSERQAVVWAALSALPPHQRTATVLYYLGEMDQGAIADFLGVPVTTVKKRVWAARRTLGERMRDYMGDLVNTSDVIQNTVQSGAPSRNPHFETAVALWAACDDGDAARMAELLGRVPEGARITDADGATLLHRAADCGHTDVVRLLLAKGVAADALTNRKRTALHALAAGSCRVEGAERLLNAGVAVDAADADGQTALEIAALGAVPSGEARGDGFTLAEFLLTRGATLSLQAAAALDKAEQVWSLVQSDKDALARRSPSGDTPLHTACRAGYRRVVKALLDAHADPNAPNADGHTPLEVALQPGRTHRLPAQQAVVRLLREKGATLTLRAAAITGDVAALKALFGPNPKVMDDTDATGATALHFAAWHGQDEAALALLVAGADPNLRDKAGRGALSVRWRASDVDFRVAETLEKAGAKPDLDVALALGRTDQAGVLLKAQPDAATAQKVRWAIESGCPPASIELLLAHGAPLGAHEAAALGDVKRLTTLLGQDLDAARRRNEERETPLHGAASRGQQAAAQALLRAGAFLDAPAGDGATPLYRAIVGGHLDLAEWLLERGAKPDLATHGGDGPLHAAGAIGYGSLVDNLIRRGADVNRAGAGRDTPLHRAAERGHPEIVRLLLKKKAQVNARNYWDGTALHVAAREGHPDVLRALLDGGAELLARDRWYRTGLHVAAYFDQAGAARLLLDAGIAVTELSYGFSSPLHTAADRGSVAVARLLVERGADVNAATDFGRTPLHDAVGRGHGEMVRFLLDAGADAKRANNRGMTPLHWAAAGGHRDIATLLRDAGADLQARSERDETPRDVAARHGRDDILALLV